MRCRFKLLDGPCAQYPPSSHPTNQSTNYYFSSDTNTCIWRFHCKHISNNIFSVFVGKRTKHRHTHTHNANSSGSLHRCAAAVTHTGRVQVKLCTTTPTIRRYVCSAFSARHLNRNSIVVPCSEQSTSFGCKFNGRITINRSVQTSSIARSFPIFLFISPVQHTS